MTRYTTLNYMPLGHKRFEVLPYYADDETRVDNILKTACSTLVDDSDFWLVSETTVLDSWIKGRPSSHS